MDSLEAWPFEDTKFGFVNHSSSKVFTAKSYEKMSQNVRGQNAIFKLP